MKRTVLIAAALALAEVLALAYGACKANDTAGNTGARKAGEKSKDLC